MMRYSHARAQDVSQAFDRDSVTKYSNNPVALALIIWVPHTAIRVIGSFAPLCEHPDNILCLRGMPCDWAPLPHETFGGVHIDENSADVICITGVLAYDVPTFVCVFQPIA